MFIQIVLKTKRAATIMAHVPSRQANWHSTRLEHLKHEDLNALTPRTVFSCSGKETYMISKLTALLYLIAGEASSQH